ncbi:MAG: dihydrolipoyl dehydrogenase [Candidatus Hodarchaeota archaeon]
MTYKTDVVVIGAGPGGYPAAIRAAQLGMKVTLVEKEYIGGECLNWGCIPSKALIAATDFYHKLKTQSSTMGITVENINIDFMKLQQWKQSVVTRLINGIKQLLKRNGIKTIFGTASFLDSNRVEVTSVGGTKELIEAKNIVIAIGTGFISLPGFEIDEKNVLSAKGLLSLNEIPKNLLIIGGGSVGIELGTVFAKLGSNVSIIELLPDILPGIEPRMTALIKNRLQKLGVKIFTSSKVKKLKNLGNEELKVEVQTKQETIELNANKILLSIGKHSSINDLKIDSIGVKTDEKGFIVVDKQQKTNIKSIYAVGDCTGIPFLAHKATKQGIIAAEVIAGLSSEADFKTIPSTIFSDPEISYAGLKEKEAKEAGFDIITGRASFGSSGRALSHNADVGFVKVIAEANTGVLLGAEIIGPDASDLISEISLGLEMGATLEDIGFTVHPHPTLPEMIMEAADAALGKAIHQMTIIPRKKKPTI